MLRIDLLNASITCPALSSRSRFRCHCADEAQRIAVDALQDLYLRLEDRSKIKPGFLDRFLNRSPSAPEQGLYLWGGVGRGKTYLMDSFFGALSFDKKKRMHFNRFMQRVHEELTELSGMKNPLDAVADRIASETMVLCFDEFMSAILAMLCCSAG